MGLPLSLFAFGEQGLALAVAYFACTVTLQFTLGISISAGNLSLSRLVRTPTIYAVVISILVLTFNIPVPLWISNTIGVPDWLRASVQTEFFIKTGLVVLGTALLLLEILQYGALGIIQALLVVFYTAVITVRLPEYWLHPYAPVLKNLPMLAVLLLLAMLEPVDRRR